MQQWAEDLDSEREAGFTKKMKFDIFWVYYKWGILLHISESLLNINIKTSMIQVLYIFSLWKMRHSFPYSVSLGASSEGILKSGVWALKKRWQQGAHVSVMMTLLGSAKQTGENDMKFPRKTESKRIVQSVITADCRIYFIASLR